MATALQCSHTTSQKGRVIYMNIFWLDKDPLLAVQYHCDKHIVKMPLELTQMLCTAHHLHNSVFTIPYKPVHQKHPCTLWIAECATHYKIAWKFGQRLFKEYTYRYRRVHASQTVLEHLYYPPSRIPEGKYRFPPQAMPDQYKHHDYVYAYQQYYIGEKARFCKWTNRTIPPFMEEKMESLLCSVTRKHYEGVISKMNKEVA